MAADGSGASVLGETDPASAARLVAEGSLLIDLRGAAAYRLDHLPGALHARDVAAWQALLADRPSWVLLYGGTAGACRRFARHLPAGAPVLVVREPAGAGGPR